MIDWLRERLHFFATYINIPTIKEALSYGKSDKAFITNHWKNVQWKDFDGGTSNPSVKGIHKNLRNNNKASSQP
jgi:hypothetical protein